MIRPILAALFFLHAAPLFAQDDKDAKDGKDDKEQKRSLRILLFADGPTREYHFVRDFLIREDRAPRVDLSIHLQCAGPESVQDVAKDRLLHRFPLLGGKEKAYDLILAFDPDWALLTAGKLKGLHDWVHGQGGGLVVVAGPVNSAQLARGFQARELQGMLPVRLVDPRLHGPKLNPETPHVLETRVATGSLAKLGGEWAKFHAVKPGKGPARGFYAAAPVESVQPRAQVIAALLDKNGRDVPFIVAMPHGAGNVVFVASGELWRLRAYDQDLHARLWLDLAHLATTKSNIRLVSRVAVEGNTIEEDRTLIEAILVDAKGDPLSPDAKPIARLIPPPTSKGAILSVEMKPRDAGIGNGTFRARLSVGEPGEYLVEVSAPDAPGASARLLVKSYQQAHAAERALFLRQNSLAIRFQTAAQTMRVLGDQLSAESDAMFVKEGKLLRGLFDLTFAEAWKVKQEELAGAIGRAKKLTDYQSALKDSQALQEKLLLLRTRAAVTENAAPEVIALKEAEETLASSRSALLEVIRESALVLGRTPADAELRRHAVELDETVVALRRAHRLVQPDIAAYRKALEALTTARIRPELARYLKQRYADQLDRTIDDEIPKMFAELRDQAQAAKNDALLRAKTREKVAAVLKALEQPAPSVGGLLVELSALEWEQGRQTRALNQIKARIEADLLNDLLK